MGSNTSGWVGPQHRGKGGRHESGQLVGVSHGGSSQLFSPESLSSLLETASKVSAESKEVEVLDVCRGKSVKSHRRAGD